MMSTQTHPHRRIELPEQQWKEVEQINRKQWRRYLRVLMWSTLIAHLPFQSPAKSRGIQHREFQRGSVTAEYSLIILAAVGFAALLIAILKSEEVRGFLLAIVQNALSF